MSLIVELVIQKHDSRVVEKDLGQAGLVTEDLMARHPENPSPQTRSAKAKHDQPWKKRHASHTSTLQQVSSVPIKSLLEVS